MSRRTRPLAKIIVISAAIFTIAVPVAALALGGGQYLLQAAGDWQSAYLKRRAEMTQAQAKESSESGIAFAGERPVRVVRLIDETTVEIENSSEKRMTAVLLEGNVAKEGDTGRVVGSYRGARFIPEKE